MRSVRTWLEQHAPAKGTPDDFSSVHVVSARTIEEYRRREHEAFERTCAWQRQLFDAGFAGRSWPADYGGQDAPSWQDDVVAEEQSRYGVSTKMLAVALEMLPPVLFAYGTHEQRVTHLPRVVRGEESWCQLLSEPNAGSDLASVTTFAEAGRRWMVGVGPEGVDIGCRQQRLRAPRRPDRPRAPRDAAG